MSKPISRRSSRGFRRNEDRNDRSSTPIAARSTRDSQLRSRKFLHVSFLPESSLISLVPSLSFLFFDAPPRPDPEFRGVGAPGVAEFTVFGCRHASTSAAAGSLLCALRARARTHVRSTPVRGAFSCFCALRSHQTELPFARLRPQRSCDDFCQIPVENRLDMVFQDPSCQNVAYVAALVAYFGALVAQGEALVAQGEALLAQGEALVA